MKHFTLKRYTSLLQETIFHISTDIENFHHVLPKYFKSIIFVENLGTEKIFIEQIKFLGISINIKTSHKVIHPTSHRVCILSGPTKGTVFAESYVKSGDGTEISIDVELRLNKFLSFFGFEKYIVKKITVAMDDFVNASEKFVIAGLKR